VHKESGGAFDLNFVRNNKAYVLLHLAATFDPKHSGPLLKSITDLGAESSTSRGKRDVSRSAGGDRVVTREGE
jgi:hypothetical protein